MRSLPRILQCLKMKVLASILISSLGLVAAQQVGKFEIEQHPSLPTKHCTKKGCKTESTKVVLDAVTYRVLHQVGNHIPCRDNVTNVWNATVCPDPATCAKNCAYEGEPLIDYDKEYGIVTRGDEIELRYNGFLKDGFMQLKDNPRVYVMANDEKYKMYYLLNQELAFDVDTSKLECGMNGALYMIPMQENGGLSATNKLGAKYGMGYCDAQCPTVAFANGLANFGAPTSNGQYGMCCAEFDIWEANKISTLYTSHPSDKPGIYNCTNDVECGFGDNYFKGVPDKSGCGFNSYKNGNKKFYGPGSDFAVDTTKKLTVVTQFITDDNTATGTLVEVRRLYKQDGKVISNSKLVTNTTSYDSITDAYCVEAVGTPNYHLKHGGLANMGRALQQGMVLSMSIWADNSTQHMGWLDEGESGSCQKGSGVPADLMKLGISVKFSNIRVGDIGTTYTDGLPPTQSPIPTKTTKTPVQTPSKSPAPTPSPATVPKWGQCGGQGYLGPVTCVSGTTCTKYNDWFSQCT